MTDAKAILILLPCLALAYLAGSIPFGLLLGKFFGAGDIRKIGSGNIGATNMLRTGRKGLALLTLILDFLKGMVGIALAQGLCDFIYQHQEDFYIAPSIECLAGTAAVLGHVYPVWLNFKGGKGVATTLGVFFAIEPIMGIVTVLGWLMTFYLTRISSLAAIACLACAPILSYLYIEPKDFAVMALVLAVIVTVKHKDNIVRLRRGAEHKIGAPDEPS